MIEKKVEILIDSQLKEWELAAVNYNGLSLVQTKSLDFGGFRMKVQYNPERIRSSAAKVDSKSISERKCFLCQANLPEVQTGLPYRNQYTILLNPYPIFSKHLTIPATEHVDQLIEGRMEDMLLLARDLCNYVIFYNGPKCGASAPDHFHFQAGNKGVLPMEEDLLHYKGKKEVFRTESGIIYDMENYERKVLIFKSCSMDWLVNSFHTLLSRLKQIQPDEEEPLLNILATFDEGCWCLYVFPRIKHRPYQFFEDGDRQVLFSPASVDMGGLLIVPRETDFRKFDEVLVRDMFSQITFPDAMWNELKRGLYESA